MKLFLLSFMVFSFIVSAGQTKGNGILYGYKETVISGRSPGTVDEIDGEPIPGTVEKGTNYYIYLSTTTRVYPSEIWLKGKPYAARMQTVPTPVLYKNDLTINKTKELVPKTNRVVLELSPIPAVEIKLSRQGRALSQGNELVVVYKQGGKFYYSSLKVLSELEKPLQ